jgi:hypothetical protein
MRPISLFQVVSRRHEQKSIVLTTNLAFKEWNTIFPNASCAVALIDRLTHHAEILTCVRRYPPFEHLPRWRAQSDDVRPNRPRDSGVPSRNEKTRSRRGKHQWQDVFGRVHIVSHEQERSFLCQLPKARRALWHVNRRRSEDRFDGVETTGQCGSSYATRDPEGSVCEPRFDLGIATQRQGKRGFPDANAADQGR